MRKDRISLSRDEIYEIIGYAEATQRVCGGYPTESELDQFVERLIKKRSKRNPISHDCKTKK
jgi:hypothetical protein